MFFIPRRTILGVIALFAACLTISSCSNDSGSSSNMKGMTGFCSLGPACRMISMACMPKDDGTAGMVHDCHVAGMETAVESACEDKLNACITVCNAAPGFGDAGGFDMPKCDGGS